MIVTMAASFQAGRHLIGLPSLLKGLLYGTDVFFSEAACWCDRKFRSYCGVLQEDPGIRSSSVGEAVLWSVHAAGRARFAEGPRVRN
jgi:hypothetical protein